MPSSRSRRLPAWLAVAVAAVLLVLPLLLAPAPASAAPAVPDGGRRPVAQVAPETPAPEPGDGGITDLTRAPSAPGSPDASISLNLTGPDGKPSQSIVLILLLTLLAVAPALLIMLTSFTRIVVVLSLTRNAVGLPTIPPNQVVIGLAMFLSLFVMGPTLAEMNREALQPFLKGEIAQGEAYDAGVAPLKEFMLEQTRESELGLFVKLSGQDRPASPEDVGMAALVPAFILSELKTAFIIGFVVFVPFLVIDLVIASSLMSMGMMMLPPIMISLPFKLLLFVMVDGWALVVRSLVSSFG